MTRPLPRVGRYALRGELGRGGVGAVYRAFDPSSGEEVAVKVLLADLDRAIALRDDASSRLWRGALKLGQRVDVAGALDDLERAERAGLSAVADLEHLGRLVRSGGTWAASQRELELARRALDGGPVAPCDWPHPHPETAPR